MVLRVKKESNYTVITNDIFKNRELSLKAKGLLCLMLSLPDNWEYSLAGIAELSSDGIDSTRTALIELENANYFRRERKRVKGKYADVEYIVSEKPMVEAENPIADEPILENPIWGNPPQLNTNNINKLNISSNKDIHIEQSGESNAPEQVNLTPIKVKQPEEYLVDSYNNICVSLPKVTKLTDKRKRHIRARLKTHEADEIKLAFIKAEQSDWLSGRKSDWHADFDWIIKSEDNLVKILENHYDNRDNELDRLRRSATEIYQGGGRL